MNKKLKRSFKKYDKSKKNEETFISGELGITLGGRKVIDVPNRKGFVYVRLKGNTSELIQAYNPSVSPVYDLPVLVVRSNGIYKVVGRNIDRNQNQWGIAPYLPKHGAQHSFNHEIGAGGDVAWIYSQQFMPLLSYPSGTSGGMMLSIQPHFYEWNGSWRFAQNTGTPDYTPYVPTITGSARMVLSYLDPSDNSIKLVPGTPFSNSLTGSAQIASYIPDIPREVGIPLAAVRLVTGTTVIGWENIYDLRDFYTVGKPSGSSGGGGGGGVDTIGFAGMDEGIPIGTGTVLNVRGSRAVLSRSGTVFAFDVSPDPAELIGFYALSNGTPLGTGTTIDVGSNLTATLSGTVLRLNATSSGGGGGGGLGVVGWDEGIYIATGTILNFTGAGVTATASGTVINVDIPGGGGAGSQETIYSEKLLYNITLSGSTSWDITGIPSGYDNLRLVISAKGSAATDAVGVIISFNNDTTDSNYRSNQHYYDSVSHSVTNGDTRIFGYVDGATSQANDFGHTEVFIPDYAGTKTKDARYFSYTRRTSTVTDQRLGFVNWENTSAINRITIAPDSGSFISGSCVKIFGSKEITVGGGSGGGVPVQDEGVFAGTGTIFNFVGAGVTASVSGSIVQVSIPGGRTLIQTINPFNTGTVSFQNIPQTYSTLEIEMMCRSTRAANDSDPIRILFNNDSTASNYRFIMVRGFGNGTASSFGNDDSNYSDIPAATAPSNSVEAGVIKIVNYKNTIFNKQAMVDVVQRRDSSSVQEIAVHGGVEWENTSAISRVDFVLSNGNYVSGTVFNLYGLT